MALDGISSFTKPHGTGGNSYSGTTIIINRGTNGKGNFNPNNCNIVNLNAHNANVDNLKVKNADIDNAVINYFMSPEGNITKITGSELNYQYGHIDDMTANAFSTEKLTVSSDANIKKLMSDYINAHEITTDTLTVTKSAHFFELIIDKIRSVQGTQINTAANCTADFVEAYAGIYHDGRDSKVNPSSHNVDYFRIYFKNADDDGRSIDNKWLTYDQAICQSFNVNEGTTYDVSNKYYWRLVEKTSNDSDAGLRYINFATNEVSNTDPGTFSINFSYGFQYGTSYTYTSYNAYTYTYSYNYTNFNVHNQVEGEWNSQTKTFTPSTTIYGIEVTPNPDDDKVLSGGSFIFNTDKKTRLNVGIYYDDGTFDYHPADEYKTAYEIETLENKNAEAFIINTAVIDKWDPCHWIDLSNLSEYIDVDAEKGYAIPSTGDVIAQLGYRYTMRPDYEDTQQWKEDNKDIVARASAIIIAAYSTPDNGDPSNNIPAIYPPSYAQYQDIITFDLSTKRGTYFDATGAYIKGNLVSGTVVDPGVNIPVVIDTWKLLSDFSIITQDSSSQISPSTITLSLLHNNGTSSTIENTLPVDKAIYVNGVLNTGGLNVPVTSFADVTITLVDTANTQTYDKIIIEAFDINAANGTNGSYIQFIYKAGDPNDPPSAPTSTAYPPSGWSTTPPTVLEPDVLFMCQRTVSFDANNNPVYPTNPAWSNPFQLSGINGEPGKDGDEIEYIYYQTEDDTPPMIYRELSDFGVDEQLAVDSGRVHADSQGHIDRWESIEGGEIIYHPPLGTTSGYIPISTYTKEGTPVQIYFSSFWTDEPQGVDEDMPYEWVALRKKDGETHQWSDFTEPVIWAHYGQDGAQGAQGPAGQNGQNGQNGKNAFNNVFTYNKADVTVTVSGQTLSSITSGLRTNIINLQMYHIENSTASLVNFIDRGYTLRLDVITFDPSNSQSFIANSSTTQLWTVTNGTTATINSDNLLSVLYPESAAYYRDYLKLQESNVAYLPIQLAIYMIDDNNVQCTDKLRIDINMQAGYINQMSKAGLYQAFFGSYSYGGQTINGMSSITATMNGISTNVQSLTYSYNTLSSDYSNFKQTSSSFQTTVTQQITTIDGNINTINGDISDINGYIGTINGDIGTINGDIGTINSGMNTMRTDISTIDQKADRISLHVDTVETNLDTLETDLQTTGIDITQGTITLDAENTVIDGNLNIYNANEGVIIYDNNKTPKTNLINKEIGTSANFELTTYNYPNINIDYSKQKTAPFNVISNKYSIGEVKANSTINAEFNFEIRGYNNITQSNLTPSITVTCNFYKHGYSSLIYSNSLTFTRAGYSDDYYYNPQTFSQSITDSDIYDIELVIQGNDNNYTHAIINCNGILVQEVDSATLIGTDGILIGKTQSDFNLITKEETVFEKVSLDGQDYYDGLKLDTTGLKRLIKYNDGNPRGSKETWIDIGGYNKPYIIDNANQIIYGNITYGGTTKNNVHYHDIKVDDHYIIIDRIWWDHDGRTEEVTSDLYLRLPTIANMGGLNIKIVNVSHRNNVYIIGDQQSTASGERRGLLYNGEFRFINQISNGWLLNGISLTWPYVHEYDSAGNFAWGCWILH